MSQVFGYRIYETLIESRFSPVYRGRDPVGGDPRTLLCLRINRAGAIETAEFRQAYEKISKIRSPYLFDILDMKWDRQQFVLVMEDFQGKPLSRIAHGGNLNLISCIDMAMGIVEILGRLHQDHIFHGNLRPDTVFADVATDEIKLNQFGVASLLTKDREEIYEPEVVGRILPYMAPEQSGRLIRAVDFRVDFYGLGATLYYLLTGRPPFYAEDPMELIHAHLTRKPIPPERLNPKIPASVSAVLMKLLAKNAEDRYQSCSGLFSDLRICLLAAREQGHVETFIPGQMDVSITFTVPQKLIGREAELEALQKTLETTSRGPLGLIIVAGPAGIGKSSLIQEMQKHIAGKRGYFVRGKFEQLGSGMPYQGLIQAVEMLTRQILSESADRITIWKRELLGALGRSGKVITEVFPDMELIIGEQPGIPAVGPQESLNRFNLMFRNFLKVISSKEHPLILFLDDLQWADGASLDLLKSLQSDTEMKYLLIIGAYRDDELPPGHLLGQLQQDIQTQNRAPFFQQMKLEPLNTDQVHMFLSECLRIDNPEVVALAAIVHQKTGGNPFFISRFLEMIYEKGMLTPVSTGGWSWRLSRIQEMSETTNVIDLMTGQISRLNPETQELLKDCACFGGRFNLIALAAIRSQPMEEIWRMIQPAAEARLVQSRDAYYEFTHDRIRETIYSLIPQDQREVLHDRIGRLMLEILGPERLEEEVFFVTSQLNLAIARLKYPEERLRLLQLNLAAGKKAKAATAYDQALAYFQTGISLIPENGWRDMYALSLELHDEALECAYLSTDQDADPERLYSTILRNTHTPLDRVKAYEVRIRMFVARNRLLDAIRTAREILGRLGTQFPKKPKSWNLIVSFWRTRLLLRRKKVSDISTLPDMRDAGVLARIRILSVLTISAFWSSPTLLPLIVFEMVRLTVRYGNHYLSPYSYTAYGAILCRVGNIEEGARYGMMALDLLDRMNLGDRKLRTHVVYYSFIHHSKAHARDILKIMPRLHKHGLETGDLEYSAISLLVNLFHSLHTGSNLKGLSKEASDHLRIVQRLKQDTIHLQMRLHHQAVLNLLEPVGDPTWQFNGPSYDEKENIPIHRQVGDRSSLYMVSAYKQMFLYLFGYYEEARHHSLQAGKDVGAVAGTFLEHGYYVFDALIHLALYETAAFFEKRGIMLRVSRDMARIRRWAHYAPMNFLHQLKLVEAEEYRVLGKAGEALACYDQALHGAREHGFLHHEALIQERMALHLFAQNKPAMATGHLKDAYNSYHLWGCVAKEADLEKRYPDLFSSEVSNRMPFPLHLDYNAVFNSLQAISTEIVLKRLQEKLMQIFLETAGGNRGVLIILRDGQACIAAERRISDLMVAENSLPAREVPLEEKEDLPHAIVNYVMRSGKYLVLEDAGRQGEYINDPYVTRYRPRSVLCLPMIRQARLLGVLYIENQLISGAFRQEGIEVLQLLTSQAAISLENAVLFQNLADTETALRKSEAKYRILAENVNDHIWVMDINSLRFTYHSPSVLQLSGFSAEEAMQIPLEESMTPRSWELATETLATEMERVQREGNLERQSRTLELEIYRKDGSTVWIEAIVRFIMDDNERPVSIIGVSRDITARRQAAEEIQKMNIELEQRVAMRTAELEKSLKNLRNAKDQLVQAEKMAALGGLVAGVAHEINTPLSVGITAATFLEDKTAMYVRSYREGKMKRSQLEKFFHSTAEASQLISKNLSRAADLVRNFKQVAVDQYSEDRRRFNMKKYIDELIFTLGPSFGKTKHKIVFNCPEDLELYSHPGAYYQIVTNLIMNSLIHGFEGIESGEIRLDIQVESDYLILCYADNGRGMNDETLQRMYDPFFTTRRSHGGTGLGMHILYNLVTQTLGGRLECSSAPNEGVTFLIRVPLTTAYPLSSISP